jgi:hypothetical protein
MTRSDQEYISFDPFFGEEGEITLRSVRLRTARKLHPCFLGAAFGRTPHQIQPGQRYREERALVDGDYFGRYCMCLPCIDSELNELEGEEE